jgi:hypothetical protein
MATKNASIINLYKNLMQMLNLNKKYAHKNRQMKNHF